MANNLLLPGGGLEFGEKVSLSRGSALRVDKAAEVFYSPFMEDHGSESKIYCTGAYPSLPSGVGIPSLSDREGMLMADMLMNTYNIPSSRIEVETEATSTTENVIAVAGMIATRCSMEIQEIIGEGSELGIVSRKGHAKRIASVFKHLGCEVDYIKAFTVYESSGTFYDVVSSAVFQIALLGVGGDTDKLISRDDKLEIINDNLRAGFGFAKKLVRGI